MDVLLCHYPKNQLTLLKIFITCRKDSGLEFTVWNPAPPLPNTEFMKLFSKGVTTKQDRSSHGFGLYNVLKLAERCHGKILTRNETVGGRNYVVFGILLP